MHGRPLLGDRFSRNVVKCVRRARGWDLVREASGYAFAPLQETHTHTHVGWELGFVPGLKPCLPGAIKSHWEREFTC